MTPRNGNPLPAPSGSTEVLRSLPTANILLVDDQPTNLVTLEASLAGLGQNLVKARSGLEALRCLLERDFAVILLDVQMPDMDGLETAALVRQRERSQFTPIIFLTAHQAADWLVLKAYATGAVDYLTKPFSPAVLRSKVAVFVEIYQKTEQVKRQGELLRQIERQRHERQLEEVKERWEAERMREEMRVAREIQQHLFPAAPLPLAGFDIGGASYPAEATGGDYFDYIPMLGGGLGVVIGDVSGHGVGPALLMAQTRAYLRAFVLTHADIGVIVTLINAALARDTPEDRFATLLLVWLDPLTRSFVYVSAGHPTAFVLDAAGEVKTRLHSTGVPLAIVADAAYEAAPPVTLEPGELVVLLTDGIMEAHTTAKELFGIDRALELVRANRHRPAREIVDTLYTAARGFCESRVTLDDMTAIIIKVESPS